MKVTDDDLELPAAVAGSAAELSRIIGISESTIKSCYSRYERGEQKRCIYRKVCVG